MTDHHVRIRIQLRQPTKDSDSTVPLHEGRSPLYQRDSSRQFRKRGRSLRLVLGGLGGLVGTLAIGLVVAYVSWPTNESESSRSEVAGVERAMVGGNDSSDNRAGMGGTREASFSGPNSSFALEGSSEGSPDLNLDTAAGLPAKHEPALSDMSQAKPAGDVLLAFPDVKRDQDPKLAEVAQEAAKVQEPSRTAGQEKALASLSSPGSPRAGPSVDKRVARSHLTSSMRGREPTDRLGSSVTLDGRKGRTVFYFTELHNLAGHTVFHRWERNGKVVATLPFKVEGKRWRIYSSNTLTSNEKGNWRVVAADTQGTVLASQNFVVVQR